MSITYNDGTYTKTLMCATIYIARCRCSLHVNVLAALLAYDSNFAVHYLDVRRQSA